jgi:hypothetical protein
MIDILQFFTVCVTVLEALGRAVHVPIRGDLPLVVAIQAVELGLIMSVTVAHSRGSR